MFIMSVLHVPVACVYSLDWMCERAKHMSKRMSVAMETRIARPSMASTPALT